MLTNCVKQTSALSFELMNDIILYLVFTYKFPQFLSDTKAYLYIWLINVLTKKINLINLRVLFAFFHRHRKNKPRTVESNNLGTSKGTIGASVWRLQIKNLSNPRLP